MKRPGQDVLDRAVDWMVLMESGRVSRDEATRFQEWLAGDARHEHAWQTVTAAVGDALGSVRGGQDGARHAAVASAALRRPPARRKWMLGAVALLAAGGTYGVHRQMPVNLLAADLRTGTGERRRFELEDGSTIDLNARSAANLAFSASERRLRLLAGAMVADVRNDERPFVAANDDGEVHTQQGVFALSQDESGSTVTVLRQQVVVWAGGLQLPLAAGHALRFSANDVGPVRDASEDAAAWRQGMLFVRDEPLENVIESLRAYRRGWLRISPEAGRLRVMGAFSLDDSDATLDALSQTLPIVVRRHGGWLVTIDMRGA
ncbi:FecR domain-containing protein [Bordetella sp. N]|uniref:FecR domain-containing protein n=1 Tax=Bordetella sp. N TaxID=1746199 RepID=UPI000708E738|nr:FecR domain-containing protein [Bordetella sp. N]ALM86107.1 hypothetical protein ASB57_26950 [Bordetella sp. N]